MKEHILHHWWRNKNIDFRRIESEIQIVDFGEYNAHENGPDFTNAKIKINQLLWCGAVEMHIKSSDWNLHKHQMDASYDNVILHVVHKKDCEIYNSKNEWIPTIEIVPFQSASKPTNWIPCEQSIHQVKTLTIINEIENAAIDRLNRKSNLVPINQMTYQYDYVAVFYMLLFRAFGNKVNAAAFEQLFFQWYPFFKKNTTEVEELLLGLSGISLPDDVQKKWMYIRAKYEIQETKPIAWKTKGFYAGSSPEKRIKQLAKMIKELASVDIYQLKIKEWLSIKEHWVNQSILTASQMDLVLINAVTLYYWWFATETQREEYKDVALTLLEALPPETNSILKKWKEIGIVAQNALDTQGLLELKNQKCTFTKCLACKIGKELI